MESTDGKFKRNKQKRKPTFNAFGNRELKTWLNRAGLRRPEVRGKKVALTYRGESGGIIGSNCCYPGYLDS